MTDDAEFPHSSNISGGRFVPSEDPSNPDGIVEITFNSGATYRYPCTPEEWLAIKNAQSTGKAVNQILKDGRIYARIK